MKRKAIDSRRLREMVLHVETKTRNMRGKCSLEGSSLKKKTRPRDDQYFFFFIKFSLQDEYLTMTDRKTDGASFINA